MPKWNESVAAKRYRDTYIFGTDKSRGFRCFDSMGSGEPQKPNPLLYSPWMRPGIPFREFLSLQLLKK